MKVHLWALRRLSAASVITLALYCIANATSFDVVYDCGAIPDGTTLNTNAIQKCIDAASAVGGGGPYCALYLC